MKAGQYRAVYSVDLASDGVTPENIRMVRSSGLPAFDQAVERAIRACNPFPAHPTNRPPKSIQLTFDPVDQR